MNRHGKRTAMEAKNFDLEELFQSLKEVTHDGSEEFENVQTKKAVDDALQEVDREDLINKFLQPSNTLPWGLLDLFQTVPEMNFMGDLETSKDADYDYKEFLQIPDLLKRTSYHFKRKGIDGKIDSYTESVNLSEIANANASNSLSISRKINTENKSLRGSTGQLPFTPGGLTMSAFGQTSDASAMASATKLLHRDEQGLFDIPQGLDRGIIPQETSVDGGDQIEELNALNEIDNELENLQEISDNRRREDSKLEKDVSEAILGNAAEEADVEIDDLLPVGIDFGRTIRKTKNDLGRKEWAHVVDLNHKIENFDELVPSPARTWPFELDVFQKEAVYHLEQGDSVFVAAHTSAGKTVVAEYAIAMAKRNMTKTIYTSPIKALSNQKFRDFKEDFEDVDVGLITGDVQINPEANCLIMTTEILRSMLYRGADLIRDVEFVIFDEVHYVNDQDRGVVWEEVIIMLPQHVKFILLSATVPNTYEFANWIGRTKQKNIYVISTPKRPVPLEINVWAKDKLIPVINEKREFLEANFKAHKELVSGKSGPQDRKNEKSGASRGRGGSTRGGGAGRGGSGRGGSRGAGAVGSNRSDFFKRSGPNKKTWTNLVNHLKSKDLLPAVIFVFSKKRCEDYADWLDGINFCSAKERSQIHMFVEKSVTRLKKEDRDLPQIIKMKSLVERGIAVHHGGLLPIVKELIELLFAKGLIRVLFATETFAMGLNLPTRTVVFSEIQKHDGNSLRNLNPGEFTQMAGRAGRRGLDKTGTVIVMSYTSPLEQASFKEVALGVPTRLQSQFRLTYNMILNLLRIEALRVEEMIKYSFSENSKQTLLPEHENKIKSLQSQLNSIEFYECPHCEKDLDKALDATIRYKECTKDLMNELSSGSSVFRVLNVGRLILFRDLNDCAKLGFVFRNLPKEGQVVVMTITNPSTLENGQPNHLPYLSTIPDFVRTNFKPFEKIEFFMENITMDNIEIISAFTLDVPMTDILKQEPEVIDKFKSEVSLIIRISRKLRETKYEKKGSLKIHQAVLDREKIKAELASYECLRCPNFDIHFLPKYKGFEIQREIKSLYHLMSDQNLSLLPDYEQRLSVLKDAGFIDQNHNVLLKGRVACEINSGYELVLTELILDNFLGDFEPEEIVALLSVFVYEGRTREEEPLVTTPRLTKGKARIQEIYKEMLNVYEKHQVPLTKDEAEFLEKKRFALMNVVYEWARGLSFKEIMEMSVESEGTIVRVITRLDEICREVKTASIIIGNSNLHMKMSQAQELIKRDIVFAASLYL
ncbi:LAQU0S01e02366g1_1 [Lachancea quebecensis]|uniref:RNA helicase n=1 Tax=Lachancea quebecensis TaxID=1654605 RepID=A0A0P1KL13_9SACH|nr:LAQU0S01e02366g1_1 [Lachancea quebecensis]